MIYLLPNYAFDFNIKSLRVINAYLSNRAQVTEAIFFYSEIFVIIFGVPKGSLLGSLVFNINISDIFLTEQYKSHFFNYADSTTPKNCWDTLLPAISDLEIRADNLFHWFCYNSFEAVPWKCHFFWSPFNLKSMNIKSSYIEG